MSTAKKGKEGEKLAARYLENKKYEIKAVNYRYKRGEIDLIAWKENVLVFVEVKLKSNNTYGFPEEAVNTQKEEMIISTAENYIYETNWNGPIRFDIISILNTGADQEILHIEDAFY